MKKCPKCKAEIQENARFCLYCMTSFEEKQTTITPKENNKRWLYIIAAVLVLAVIAISVFLLIKKNDSSKGKNGNSNNSSVSGNLEASNDDSTSSDGQENNESQGNEQTDNPSNDNDNDDDDTIGNPNDNIITDDTPPDDSSGDDNDNDSDDDIGDTSTNTQPKYTYIEATFENAYPTGYSTIYAPENAIVITKVNHKEESGNYVIPDTIDGKKVAAVMPLAFSDASISSTVKSITLPSTVRTIWGDAFKDCFNLTDLYIKSAVIGIYEDAFPASSKRNGRLTIHCKKDCRDFDFYYYRNIASRYDANYIEWNG